MLIFEKIEDIIVNDISLHNAGETDKLTLEAFYFLLQNQCQKPPLHEDVSSYFRIQETELLRCSIFHFVNWCWIISSGSIFVISLSIIFMSATPVNEPIQEEKITSQVKKSVHRTSISDFLTKKSAIISNSTVYKNNFIIWTCFPHSISPQEHNSNKIRAVSVFLQK